MSEITLYEAQKKKMQGLCDEHDLVFRFRKDTYPITFTIRQASDMDSQMSMLENVEEDGYRSPDATMTWIFQDGVLETKVQGGTFTIGKTLRGKIELTLMKMISYWQQYFFRNLIEIIKQGGLSTSYIPVIEDEAEDTMTAEKDSTTESSDDFPQETMDDFDSDGDDDALPDGEDDEGGTPPRSLDDPDIKEAARIVRMANKATTSLLQRHMSVGYAKAGRLLDALE